MNFSSSTDRSQDIYDRFFADKELPEALKYARSNGCMPYHLARNKNGILKGHCWLCKGGNFDKASRKNQAKHEVTLTEENVDSRMSTHRSRNHAAHGETLPHMIDMTDHYKRDSDTDALRGQCGQHVVQLLRTCVDDTVSGKANERAAKENAQLKLQHKKDEAENHRLELLNCNLDSKNKSLLRRVAQLEALVAAEGKEDAGVEASCAASS